jgi:molybdopterin biosynthesis enzyme
MKTADPVKHTPDCADDADPGLLSVAQAEQHFFASIRPLDGPERMDMRNAPWAAPNTSGGGLQLRGWPTPAQPASGAQGSGILTSMGTANCFFVLAADQGQVKPGDLVTVEPFDGWF